jgi:hypothetical protein
VDSKPVGTMDVCLLWMLCVVRDLCDGADPSSRGVLRNVYMSLSVIRCHIKPIHLKWLGRKRSD